MHKFLVSFDNDSWAFLKDHSKRNGRTVAGTIRMLVEDLYKEDLYGKKGMFEDLPFPEDGSGVSSAFWALDIGEVVIHNFMGRGRVVSKDLKTQSFAVHYDNDVDGAYYWYSWDEDWKDFVKD